MPRRQIPPASFCIGPANSRGKPSVADGQQIIVHRPTPLSNITPLQLVRGGGGGTHPQSSLPSLPISYPYVPTLAPSPSLVLFRAAPVHPAHKTHRYTAEEPTRAAYAVPLTKVSRVRISLQRPPLLVVRVNTKARPHRRQVIQPLPPRARLTGGRRSSARSGPRRGDSCFERAKTAATRVDA